jgi:hypothetical protein
MGLFEFLGLRGIEWANLGSEGPRKLCIPSDLGFRRGL